MQNLEVKGNCPECGKPITFRAISEADDKAHAFSSLEEAHRLIGGERQNDYGTPENSFSAIANLWTVYFNQVKGWGVPLFTPRDVAAMMVLLKIARGTRKRDNWIDIIGYAAIAADRLEG